MIDIAWLEDDYAGQPEDYLIPWNDPHSWQRAFLAGWTRYLNEGAYETEVLHWHTLGAYYASVPEDISENPRRQLYYAALAEFLKSQKCAYRTDAQRRECTWHGLHLASDSIPQGIE